MVNTSNLNNLSEFQFNTTVLNDSNNISREIVSIANPESSGYLGLVIMTVLFIWMLYILLDKDGFFQFDFVKGGVIASGVVTVIGSIMLISDLISSFQHVVWYAIIFAVLVISSYFLKKKGI